MVQAFGERIGGYRTGDRAVSPVIGIALMVAITVILAAVIGAFVTDLAGENDNSPNAALEFSQEERYLNAGGCECRADSLIAPTVTHVGGEPVTLEGVYPTVTAGNTTLGITGNDTVYDVIDRGEDELDDWEPVPNTSRRTTLEAADELRMSFYGIPEEHIAGPPRHNLTDYDATAPTDDVADGTKWHVGVGNEVEDDFPRGHEFRPRDRVRIVWSPADVETSTVLTRYEVR